MSAELHSVDEYKVRARILLSALRSDVPERQQPALVRLRTWPPLANLKSAERDTVQLKHALAVVAQEAGFPSWLALRRAAERADDPTERLYPGDRGGFLNAWFASYDEARAWRETTGAFLLPYRHQFFVCNESYIQDVLGLSPADADWERIGRDWARPRDPAAWKRLSDALGGWRS